MQVQPSVSDDDRLMSLVESAMAQPPGERDAWLRCECAGDTQLFEHARDYVESEERMGGFLLKPFCTLKVFDPVLEPGEVLEGRFRIVRQAGEGGMAMVYEAFDETLKKRIAVKCAKAGFDTRLTPEVSHATEISHDNVCKIFDFHSAGRDRGEIDFITMEFLDGRTLTERLAEGPLPEREARAIARQLCAGLAAAHRNQVIHGDLKSNNVILTKSADGTCARSLPTSGWLERMEQGFSLMAPPPANRTRRSEARAIIWRRSCGTAKSRPWPRTSTPWAASVTRCFLARACRHLATQPIRRHRARRRGCIPSGTGFWRAASIRTRPAATGT